MRHPYQPVTIPRLSPHDLSPAAAKAIAVARNHPAAAGDLDPAVLAELVMSGLIRLVPRYVTGVDDPIDGSARVSPTRAHPLVSACDIGRGPSDIDVYLTALDGGDPLLIAALRGAELSQQGAAHGELPRWRIAVRSGATDFEHDSCRHADLELIGLTLAGSTHGIFELAGTLAGIRMFPLGVDPLAFDDGESSPGWCHSEQCQGESAHRIAAYIPPERDDLRRAFAGRLVSVVVYPRPGLSEEGPSAS